MSWRTSGRAGSHLRPFAGPSDPAMEAPVCRSQVVREMITREPPPGVDHGGDGVRDSASMGRGVGDRNILDNLVVHTEYLFAEDYPPFPFAGRARARPPRVCRALLLPLAHRRLAE